MPETVTEVELATEINEMYNHMKETSLDANPPELLEELQWCNAHLARSAQLLAEAGKFLNIKKGEYAEKHEKALKATKEKFNATLFKHLLEFSCKDYFSLHTQAERLNRTITHRIESIRTAISFEKSLR